ncbi:MAG: Ig-like domain-containing protein [Myxococcota bacterium]|nr:Ig-like domain-containing protein [Myxococcota bacterium]
MRHLAGLLLGGLLGVLAPGLALAGPKPTTMKIPPQVGEHAAAAQVLYFNRCVGGCTVTKGSTNDARTRSSTIPNGAQGDTFTLSAFRHSDTVWNDLMQCLREVYSPYNVLITDEQPAAGIAYNENIVAGVSQEINYNAGGVAPVTSDCSPYSYVISYTFANGYGPNPLTLCYVAAQETGHAFGMADHSWSFISDGRSACSDPMSYREDCLSNGQRFFRNEAATCGDFSQEPCNCSGMNSHAKLIAALGPGTSITPAPTVTVTQPAAGAQIQNGAPVIATAYSKRGVKRVELFLNGFKWGERNGVAFGQTEQPASPYSIPLPADVPDGVIDIVVKANDDLGVTTTTEPITVTKGAPCASAETCALGQKCEAGKCFWDPAAGQLGDACTYPQFCVTGKCLGPTGAEVCTQGCIPGVGDSCPLEFQCIETGPAMGICYPGNADDGGGCCSSSNEGFAGSALLGLGLLALLVPRRRRRSR